MSTLTYAIEMTVFDYECQSDNFTNFIWMGIKPRLRLI